MTEILVLNFIKVTDFSINLFSRQNDKYRPSCKENEDIYHSSEPIATKLASECGNGIRDEVHTRYCELFRKAEAGERLQE
jgi:hypothetical protein